MGKLVFNIHPRLHWTRIERTEYVFTVYYHSSRVMSDELTYLVLTAFDETSGQNYTSSKALELVRKLPDPAAIRDYKQRTLLHHACWNGWLDVVKILIEQYSCDPNAVDDVGSTPLHWACHSSTDIVKYLVLERGCDPTSCNRYRSTPLHWACRSKQPDVKMVRFLVQEARCDPSAVELGGNTPLHAACVGGSLEIVQLLLQDARCDASCRNENGETLLHKASQEGHYDIVKYLIMERGCNPSCKDKEKETPLHLASGGGHLDIVQYLCLDQRADPNCKNVSEDWTPLHKACVEGRLSVVKFLVNHCKCNALKTNQKGESPFTLACIFEHIEVVVFLLTIIDLEKAPSNVSRILGSDVVQGVLACKRNHPLHPAFKLFVVGNPSAGKSTLIKTLQNKLLNTTLIKSMGAQFSNVKGVELKTAGIIPVHVKNAKEGHIIMYDFAGQHEYYSSHAAVMESIASAPGSLVLIVVDLSRDKEEIAHCLNYWSSFINNLTGQSSGKPHLVVVGSHADVVKATIGEQPSTRLSDVCQELKDLSSTAKVALNCKRLASPGLNVLFDLISSHAQKFQKRFDMDLQAYFVNAVIKQSLSNSIACHFSDIVKLTSSDKNSHLHRHNLLPESDEDLAHHLSTLSEHGQLLFLKNDLDISKSWVILNKEVLLSEINGVLFAPAYFKQHQHVSTPSGIVSFSKLKSVFPTYDTAMIISFLTHLEFCQRVTEREASLINGQRLESDQPLKPENYYYFAKLVKHARPDDVSKSIEASHYKCGWFLHRKHNHQFLMCRFLHILMSRIVFEFALRSVKTLPVGAGNRFKVWKNGVYWRTDDGIEALVEAMYVNHGVMVTLGCPAGKEVECVQLRSDIIRTVLKAKQQFSAAVEMTENLIYPIESQLAVYPLKLPLSLPVSSLSKAIEEGSQMISSIATDDCDMHIRTDIKSLLYFEPYTCLTNEIVQKLFNPVSANLEVSDDLLNKIARTSYTWSEQLQKALNVSDALVKKIHMGQQATSMHSSCSYVDPTAVHPVSECLRKLRAWKQSTTPPTHQRLREALDSCSVFAGRNPLVRICQYFIS